MSLASTQERILSALSRRILVLDGAMGTMIQRHKLVEADFRGERFRDHTSDLKGNNDLLALTRPDVLAGIHDEYLAAGLPIATGVVEGACRYVVKDRCEVTGAHWTVPGAEAVLRLRSLRASGDFEVYWKFHLKQEHARNHAARYAKSSVGLAAIAKPTADHSRSHLRVIK